MIVSPSLLPKRDTAIHESAHFIIGQAVGIPVADPVIAPDRQSGHVATRLDPLPPGTDKAAFLAQFEPHQVREAAMKRAVFCLAGLAAESALNRSHWGEHRIIGAGTSDLKQAQRALKDAKCSEADLWICWHRARRAVDRNWTAICEMAKSL